MPAWCTEPGYRIYMKMNFWITKVRSNLQGKDQENSFAQFYNEKKKCLFISKIKYSNMSPEGSIHFFCPPCRLKISEWPSPLFPAWSWNKKNENLLTGNTQGVFLLPTYLFLWGPKQKFLRSRGKPAYQERVLVWSQPDGKVWLRELTRLGNTFGPSGWETHHERTVEAVFHACSGFSWINSGMLPTVWAENHTPGGGVGCHAPQHSGMCFSSYQDFTHQLLFCKKAKNPLIHSWLGNWRGDAGNQKYRSTVTNILLPHLTELWLITSTETVSAPVQDSIPAWKSTDCTTLLQQNPQSVFLGFVFIQENFCLLSASLD